MKSGVSGTSKWLIGATATIAMVAGGLALGSNMGFKFNAQIISGAGAAPKFDNWLSFPENGPYPKASNVCSQLGLLSTGPAATRGSVARVSNISTGLLQTFTCGGALGSFTVTKGEAMKIRTNNAAIPTFNAIIVGSDDPNNTIVIVPGVGAAPKFDNWVSVPYHTTAVKAADLCTDMGLTSTGPTALRGTVARMSVISTGFLQTYTCGGALGSFTLTVGEGIKVRTNNATAKNWVASHF
jgi:hypothetical protein